MYPRGCQSNHVVLILPYDRDFSGRSGGDWIAFE